MKRWIATSLLLFALLAETAKADMRCPEGAQLTGDTPPRATGLGCVMKSAEGKLVRQGPWIEYYANGQISEEGEYLRGQRNGAWKWWYPTGLKMQEGEFTEGIPIGQWKYWRADGSQDEKKMRAEAGSIANFAVALKKKLKAVR